MRKLPDEILRVHAILEDYVSIHNQIFKPSLRKVIAVPGFFKPIDFAKHFKDLGVLTNALEEALSTPDRQYLPPIFSEYVTALFRTVVALRDLCKELESKSEGGTKSYSMSQYNVEVAAYQELVAEYQRIGSELNRQIMAYDFAGGPTDQSQFNRWTNLWIDVASNVIADVADIRAELGARDKLRLAALVFERVELECIAFMRIVIGESRSVTSEGVCYNRLTEVPIQQMSRELQSKTIDLLQETFYLGLFTQLYACSFPTREKISSVDLAQVFRKWMVDAIAPSHVLGKMDRLITDIFQVYFSAHIEPLLKQEFRVGMFGLGRHMQFFRELYLAGFLLGLECDMATKQ